MVVETARSMRIFYAYSRKDTLLMKELLNHLESLRRSYIRQGYINGWYDGEILPGTDWTEEINENLNKANIILLLISADFLASKYCYEVEVKKALERHEKREAHVIPVILRSVYWGDERFSRLQVLPTGGRAVTDWGDRDKAFVNITEGVRKVINEFLKKRILDDAKIYLNNSQYEEALDVYEQLICLIEGVPTPSDAFLYKDKGDILVSLTRYEEALTAYDEAIGLVGHDVSLYIRKGDTLVNLNRYEEALEAYDIAISLGPKNVSFFEKKGSILFRLERYKEALEAYDIAISLEPRNVEYYSCRGDILFIENRYEEALKAYEKAIDLDPDHVDAWRKKGQLLVCLNRLEYALAAYEKATDLDAKNAYLYKEKGDILLKLKRLEDALDAYKNTVDLKPDFRIAFSSIGMIYEELARQAYEKAEKQNSEK